jgi:hypothetical protein
VQAVRGLAAHYRRSPDALSEAEVRSYRVRALLNRILRMQAENAAANIRQFIREIESQVGWTVQLPWSAGTIDQRRYDDLRLLREVPAIAEIAQLDSAGIEQLRVSRLCMDVVGVVAEDTLGLMPVVLPALRSAWNTPAISNGMMRSKDSRRSVSSNVSRSP